jgi:hypothetical protein
MVQDTDLITVIANAENMKSAQLDIKPESPGAVRASIGASEIKASGHGKLNPVDGSL